MNPAGETKKQYKFFIFFLMKKKARIDKNTDATNRLVSILLILKSMVLFTRSIICRTNAPMKSQWLVLENVNFPE